jgi:hypothetical protein
MYTLGCPTATLGMPLRPVNRLVCVAPQYLGEQAAVRRANTLCDCLTASLCLQELCDMTLQAALEMSLLHDRPSNVPDVNLVLSVLTDVAAGMVSHSLLLYMSSCCHHFCGTNAKTLHTLQEHPSTIMLHSSFLYTAAKCMNM